MAIMKWNTPPSGTHHDRRAHVVGHGDGVSLAHAAFGSNVEGSMGQTLTNPNHELATKYSTAPYRGPDTIAVAETEPPNVWGYRSPKRMNKCMGNNDTCKAWAVDKYDKEFCNAHGNAEVKKAETELQAQVEHLLDGE